MNTRLIDLTESDLRAIVAHEVRQALAGIQPAPQTERATKRLSRLLAAKHLGVCPSTLDNWVKAGHVKKHYTATNKPFFLLGELNGVGKNRGR